jgi:hypothetical protein
MRINLLALALAGSLTVAASAETSLPDMAETVGPAAASPAADGPTAADGLRDEAAMVIVGTALIGLAAALRRAA